MKRILAAVLCLLLPIAVFASDNSYKVDYDGGTIAGVKVGNDLKLYIDSTEIKFMKGKDVVQVIPVAAVTELSYGQDVHRRVGAAIGVGIFTLGAGALLALAKSKKHFVGITWANGTDKGGLAMQCDKNDYRGILTALEGVTGKKAVDSEALNVKN
jgi:hypothetical protein